MPAIAAEQLKREGLRICNFVQPPPDRVSILVTRAGEELSEYGKIFLQELGESIRGVKDANLSVMARAKGVDTVRYLPYYKNIKYI